MHLSAVVCTCIHRCSACWQSSLVHLSVVRHGLHDALQAIATRGSFNCHTHLFHCSTSMIKSSSKPQSFASPDFPASSQTCLCICRRQNMLGAGFLKAHKCRCVSKQSWKPAQTCWVHCMPQETSRQQLPLRSHSQVLSAGEAVKLKPVCQMQASLLRVHKSWRYAWLLRTKYFPALDVYVDNVLHSCTLALKLADQCAAHAWYAALDYICVVLSC